MTVTYLSLEEATHQAGVAPQVLTQLIAVGLIETHQTPTGAVLVRAYKNENSPEPQTKEAIIAARFAHLRGQWLSAYGAQKEHGIHHSNFINWARAGYIQVLGEGERALRMDAAEVAYCAWVYKQKKQAYKGRLAGVRVFDEAGNPYQVKYPDLAAKRRSPCAD